MTDKEIYITNRESLLESIDDTTEPQLLAHYQQQLVELESNYHYNKMMSSIRDMESELWNVWNQ